MEENKNAVGKLFDKFYSRLDYLKGKKEKEDDENMQIVYKEKIDELESFIDELDSKISKIIDEEYQNLWGRFSRILKSNKEEISEKKKVI